MRTKRNPIGRVWTAALRSIWSMPSQWLATASKVGEDVWPNSSMSAKMREVIANAMLFKIAKAGYISCSAPRGPMFGVIWSLTPLGVETLREADAPHRRSRKKTKCSPERLAVAKKRRDGLAALNLCINGASHGQRTHGVRCDACIQTHRRSA